MLPVVCSYLPEAYWSPKKKQTGKKKWRINYYFNQIIILYFCVTFFSIFKMYNPVLQKNEPVFNILKKKCQMMITTFISYIFQEKINNNHYHFFRPPSFFTFIWQNNHNYASCFRMKVTSFFFLYGVSFAVQTVKKMLVRTFSHAFSTVFFVRGEKRSNPYFHGVCIIT